MSFFRRSIAACAFVVLATGAGASTTPAANDEPSNAVVFRGVAHDAIYDIAFEGRDGIAVGANGLVLASADGGRTWSELPKRPTRLALLGVNLVNGRAVVVGQQGLVFVRDGENWQPIDSGTKERLFAVDIGRAGIGVAVGGFGTVLRTVDGGRTWARVAFDWTAFVADAFEPHLYAVHVAETGATTIAGEFGLILQSFDGGQTWAAANRGEASVFGVTMEASGKGVAVGQDGLILLTSDGGATWRRSESGTKGILLDVWIEDENAIAIGIRAAVSSGDAGETWRPASQSELASDWYQVIAVPGRGEGPLAGGNGARIVKLTP